MKLELFLYFLFFDNDLRVYNHYYNDIYNDGSIAGSVVSVSGTAVNQYNSYNIEQWTGRIHVFKGTLRVSGYGNFNIRVKIPGLTKKSPIWLSTTNDIKSSDATNFVDADCCITVDQSISGNDSYFDIKGFCSTSDIAMIGFWSIGKLG